MCNRDEFERRFPVPNGVKWSDKQGDYTYECIQALQVTCAYSGKWEAWQAARAQHDGSGEAVKWCKNQSHQAWFLRTGEQCSCAEKFEYHTRLYTNPSTSVPDGWKLVPPIPTSEMLDGWFDTARGEGWGDSIYYDGYRAMIEAAPEPPTQAKQEDA